LFPFYYQKKIFENEFTFVNLIYPKLLTWRARFIGMLKCFTGIILLIHQFYKKNNITLGGLKSNNFPGFFKLIGGQMNV
jgi:hypothetical protein